MAIDILARGDVFADVLAGVPLAYENGGPVLLTQSNKLPPIVKEEILRLGVKKVFLLGGEAAIGQTVETQLKIMGIEVYRVGGKDRYDTAAAISALLFPKGTKTVFLAHGANFSDTWAAASYAAAIHCPILFTRTDEIPESTRLALVALNPDQVIVVGGSSVIGDGVTGKLINYLRIAGADRFETAVALAEKYVPGSSFMFVASGLDAGNGADALTGAALAAKMGTGILLVRNNLPDAVAHFLGKSVQNVRILGGNSSISDSLSQDVELYRPGSYIPVVHVTGITIEPEGMTLIVGGATGTITATISPTNASNKKVTWSSSDTNVATVADGVVTPVGAGTAAITVTTADGGFTATCDITVKATAYTVTFNCNGGISGEMTRVVDYNSPVGSLPSATRDGHTFNGWNTAQSGTGDEFTAETVITDDITVYAQWTVNQYTVTFDSAGGTPVAAITQNYGTPVTAPDDPTKTGHTFDGWIPAVPATMPAGNVTCVAQWTLLPKTVTGLSIIANPVKLDYVENQALDLTGLMVKVYYNDGTEIDVALGDFSAHDITTDPVAGTLLTVANHDGKRVNVYCGEYGPAGTATLNVVPRTVTNIKIKNQPDNLNYIEGDVLDLSGLVVTLTYNNGSTEDVAFADFVAKGITAAPADSTALTTADTKVTLTHTASGKFVDQAITVVETSSPLTLTLVDGKLIISGVTIVSGSSVVISSGGSDSPWVDLSDGLQIRVTENFPEKLSGLTFSINSEGNLTVTGSKVGGSLSGSVLVAIRLGGTTPAYFTVTVSGSGGPGTTVTVVISVP